MNESECGAPRRGMKPDNIPSSGSIIFSHPSNLVGNSLTDRVFTSLKVVKNSLNRDQISSSVLLTAIN